MSLCVSSTLQRVATFTIVRSEPRDPIAYAHFKELLAQQFKVQAGMRRPSAPVAQLSRHVHGFLWEALISAGPVPLQSAWYPARDTIRIPYGMASRSAWHTRRLLGGQVKRIPRAKLPVSNDFVELLHCKLI